MPVEINASTHYKEWLEITNLGIQVTLITIYSFKKLYEG